MSNDPISISELNAASPSDFSVWLEALYEHSPWVVETAAEHRPFADLKSMQAAMESVIYGATLQKQKQLIAAHPDLAAKLEQIAELTDFSKAEQARAGFASLDPETLEQLRSALATYRKHFGHSFILCVSEHAATETLPILLTRTKATPEAEHIACLAQIARIGWHRLTQLVK